MLNKEKRNKIITATAVFILVVIIIIVKVIDKHYQKGDKQNIDISSLLTEDEYIEETSNEKIKVYIAGEVKNEGVIELEEGSRIVDAIEKAGGKTDQSDLKNVNLAYELEDGQKIYIPNINENNIEDVEIIDDSPNGIVNETEKSEIININKADEKELQNLNGIGESLAMNIVKYREENGNFKNIEDLINVPGIGESKFETIRDQIKVK